MKEKFIDTQTTDEECEEFLKKAFHSVQYQLQATLPVPEGSDHEQEHSVDQVRKTCHAEFGGLCELSTHRALVGKLVRVLNRAFQDNDVKVGNLVVLRSESLHFLGFLGVCMARPMLHTLVEAKLRLDDDVVSFVNPSLDTPSAKVLTSHEFFHQMAISGPITHVTVEVWNYTVSLQSGLQIHLGDKKAEFDLDPAQRQVVRKPHVRTRFNLKLKNKRRKRTSRARKSSKKKSTLAVAAKRNKRQNDKQSQSGTSDSSATSTVSGKSEGPNTAEDLIEAHTFLSENFQSEDASAKVLIEEHERVRDEVEAVYTTQPEPASSSQVSHSEQPPKVIAEQKAQAKQGKGYSSFFSKQCGLEEVAVAVSNRSSCYYCKNRIAKGSVRCSWYHNVLRPSAWVHEGCLTHLILRDGFLSETKKRLALLKRQASSSQTASITNAVESLQLSITNMTPPP